MTANDIEHKLDRKVDDWKFHSLESEVRSLKSQVEQSDREISYLKGRVENQYRTIADLIQIIIEQNIMPECENMLHNLKSSL